MRAEDQHAVSVTVEDYKDRQWQVASDLWAEHRAYLEDRGVPARLALEMGFRSASGNALRALLGTKRHVGFGFVIPYGHDYWVLRHDYPTDGRKFQYPGGTPSRPYLPPLIENTAWSDVGTPIVFVEGPVKAAALACNGIVAVGLAGATGGGHDAKLKREQGFIRLHEQLLRDIRWNGRTVFVMLDNDAHTNATVARGGELLCEALLAAGAIPHLAHVPIIAGEGKMGADDFLHRMGKAALLQHLAQSVPWVRPPGGSSRKYARRLTFPVVGEFAVSAQLSGRYSARSLYALYEHWCQSNRRLPASEIVFSRTLQAHHCFKRTRSKGYYFWTVLPLPMG